MYTELFENLKNVCKIESITPNANLIPVRQELRNGFFNNKQRFDGSFEVDNGTVILSGEDDSVYWIKTISLYSSDIGCELKLHTISADGASKTVYPKKREVEGSKVYLEFEVDDFPVATTFVSSTRATIIQIGIFGSRLKNISDSIEMSSKLWSDIEEKNLSLSEVVEDETFKQEQLLKETKGEVERYQQLISELNESNDIAQNQLVITRDYLKTARAELDEANQKVQSLGKQEDKMKIMISNLSSEVREVEEKRSDSVAKLTELKKELDRYEKDMLSYSEDFSAYKDELSKQNDKYFAVLAFLLVASTLITYQIYQNALSTVDNFQFNFDLWTLAVSRFPIIAINLFVLGTLTSLVYFILKLITDNAKNVATTKQVTCLVKECVEAQAEDLEVTEKEKLRQRVESKMSLIRDLTQRDHTKEDNLKQASESKLVESLIEQLSKLKK